jgi:hypothetical protein
VPECNIYLIYKLLDWKAERAVTSLVIIHALHTGRLVDISLRITHIFFHINGNLRVWQTAEHFPILYCLLLAAIEVAAICVHWKLN